MAHQSVPYGEESLEAASAWVASLHTGGGTNILNPMNEILSKPTIPGCPRQVFLLTDGQVRNTEAVISSVAKHAHDTRVFAFGIGRGVSHHLCEGFLFFFLSRILFFIFLIF